MIFTADKLKEARDAGYSDDEIFSFASQSDPKFNDAKSEGYSLDEIASYFSTQQPVGTSVEQEVSQLGTALKSGIAQPLQAMGVTAETLGMPAVGAALKGAVEQPEGYIPAAQRFMEPQAGEAQIGGFALQYLPRAIVEQVGQLAGSVASRAAGGVIGGAAGSVVPGAGTAVGAGIGMFTGPALFEAAQIVGPVAQERAKNNGREIPNSEDLAYAWTTAGTGGALNAIGAKYLPGGEKAAGALSKRIAASFLGEGATEGAQALAQQTGETIFTEKGLEIKPKAALGEALIGGVSASGATIVMSPLQKEQVDIDKQADLESRDLSIPVDDPEVRANLDKANILEQENKDSLAIINKFGVESEEGKAAQQTIVDNTDEITKINETLPASASLLITEAEKQQIELAKAIATPEVTPAPTEVTPTEVAVAEAATPVEQVPPKVENVSSIPTPEESKKWDDLSAYQKPIIEAQETEALDLLASKIGVKRQGISDVKLQEKIITNTHPDDIQDALVELKLSPSPTPVAETPAVTEAPAAEVAPVEPLTDDQAETIRDVITLRKSQGRELNPEQVTRLAEYDARKAGVEVQEGDIISNIVVGHPMFEAPQPELSNLVPIKVQNKEQLASPIQRTQKVRDAAQSYIGQYQVEQAKAKTPAQKKAFAKKFNKSELDRQRDILDYIKNDVMPELDRLEKTAPSATPAVSETITPAAEVEQKPSKPLSMMEQAEANFTKKYGMTPDDARNKFLKEKKLTSEKLNKLPLDKQRELYQEYDSWKENLIVTPAAEPAGKPKLGEKGGVLIPSREDFIQAGQNIYEKGMEFGAWAKQMIQQFGDVVREFLGDVWQAVSGAPAKLNELMGYLPGKGEAGALRFGKGKLERYTDKGTIVGLAIRQEKDTPKGILSETIKIIKQRVFDGDSTPSESVTKKAWGLIERLQATNENSAENAEAINQLTRETMQEVSVAEDATEAERKVFEAIKQTVGATKLNNELYKYAIKLAGQGDNSMLNYLLNNELNVIGKSNKTTSDAARTLRAAEGLKSYIIQANEAEQAGFIQLAAQRFFNTTTPTEDQIAKIKRILTAVNETKVNEEEVILDELTQVGEKIGTELVENINTQIDKATKPEIKDPLVAAITAMLRMGGTFVYTKTKNKIKAAVEKTIKSGITNYRSKLIEGAANGLETGFWKTLSNQENKPGPLGELDNAQNRELGSIVKNALISLGLKGTPPNTKMSIYEQVASILGEKPLSQDKTKSADEKIRQEIESKRQSDLESTEDEDAQNAINLKYDKIELAWDQAMSRQLDMPISDTLLRRLIFNELKEGKTNLAGLAELMNNDPTVGASRQNMVVSAIINKIAGVTFEGQNPADYSLFREYLSNNLESMVQEKQMEKKVVKVKEKVEANQAEREIDKLARIQSDTPNFPTSEKIANPVRDAVRNALKLVLNPMFDPKASMEIMNNWKKSFAAELQALGVDEATALTLTDIVGRQIELDSISKNLQTITNAVEKGALNNVIDAIKNTPLAEQQKPNWRYGVMFDYLRNAGLTKEQAERIAKLMDISLQKRFAKAQEEAAASIAKTILGGIKPESNRGFVALIQAIRAQILNPGSNVAKEFGKSLGWKGFTSEQLKALNEFDSKINDETITDAERAVALEGIKKIIDKVALPQRVRDSLSAFYIGQALGRFTTATVQVIDPIFFSGWDAVVASLQNVTSPSQVMQIWGNYVSSLINAAREFAFSFKNDVTRSGRLVDYLETQDRKLKRLNNDANNLWKNGQYKQAIKKYLFGYPEITSRVLKALDDASFSLLQQNALNQYMISAMNMAKIPKSKQLGALRMIAQARQMDIANMMADGISKNDATIYANERMKAEISRIMSGLNLNSNEIVDSAINDSLSRIGKTRFKEQNTEESEKKDEGTLSYPFLQMYELTSKAVSAKKGVGGEVMRIFQRVVFGFPLIVARVANVAYSYTPLTIYRHAMQKYVGNYPLTYGTAMQKRKRWVEQLTGLAVLAPLLALRSMSFDDDEEKPVRIVFTGFGPVKSKDPETYNQWHKKHNPGSIELFIGDTKYAIDSKSAGPLKPMIEILGAIDDWQVRSYQDKVKIKKSDLTNAQENAGLLSTLSQIAGSFALTAARRGPATGMMQGLIDFRRYPDDPIAAIAQEASFSLMPFVPVVGYGATKNFSDFLSDPIDTRTKEGAILNNIPIVGPMFGKPAINSFGQPLGDVQVSEKIKKSIGIPVTVVSVGTEDEQKLTKITLKNGDGPQPLNRGEFDKKLGSPLTDEEWRTATETYARENRKTVLTDYKLLNDLDPETYRTAISTISTGSKNEALSTIDKQRKK